VAFDTAEITTRICPVDGILSIFGNRYSMPSHLVGQVVTVRIAETQIQVFHDQKLVAAHQRVLDVHGQTLIDPKHYDDLRAARAKGSGGDTAATPLEAEFLSLGPESDKFLEGLQKKYASGALGHVAKILQLKRDYASEHIHQAIAKALSFEAFDWRRVAGILAADFSRTLPPGQAALDPGTVARVKQWIQEFRVTNRDLSEYQKQVFSNEEENDESPKPTHGDDSAGSEPPRGLDPGNAGAAQTPDDRPRV
jgi:hypothetical protein